MCVFHAKFLKGKENQHASHFLQNHNPLIPRVSAVSGPSAFSSAQQMRKQSHQKAPRQMEARAAGEQGNVCAGVGRGGGGRKPFPTPQL